MENDLPALPHVKLGGEEWCSNVPATARGRLLYYFSHLMLSKYFRHISTKDGKLPVLAFTLALFVIVFVSKKQTLFIHFILFLIRGYTVFACFFLRSQFLHKRDGSTA